MGAKAGYHIGFGREELGVNPPVFALLCGAPERARRIATQIQGVQFERKLSDHRGLESYLATLPNGRPIISATSGMGAPSLSIVVNELFEVGIRQIIRVGTCGSIQRDVQIGSVVISRAALCRQGAANDIAPIEYPAAASPFLTVALVKAAAELNIDWHVGITASVDSFFEGQERIDSSANKRLMRWLGGVTLNPAALQAAGIAPSSFRNTDSAARIGGITEEYRNLNILNYEMEAGTLFKMAGVYGFGAACVCGVIANRTQAEDVALETKNAAEENAIRIALKAAEEIDPEVLGFRYSR